MTKGVEGAEEISFNEFRAWLTGLIRGKGGQIPDLEDWKQIKIMMDKVVPEVQRIPSTNPIFPNENPFVNPPPFSPPPRPQWNDTTNKYGGFTTEINNYTVPVSVSYGNTDLENLNSKIDSITSATYSAEANPSLELSIAIDELIKAQKEKKA